MNALPAGVWRRPTRQTRAIGQVTGCGPIERNSIRSDRPGLPGVDFVDLGPSNSTLVSGERRPR
jgi:hypothetical protein